VIVLNLRAVSLQLRNLIRRHKWRLRPFKRVVLPVRKAKRAMKRLWTTPPRIEESTLAYATRHPEISVREIHPEQTVLIPPAPFSLEASTHEEKSNPVFVFEIPNVNFWAHYGGAVVSSDNALLADLSPDVWGVAQHQIFSRWRLPSSRLLNGRIGIAVTPEAGGNYYHWMLDALPRLFLLRHATGNFSNYDAILINGSRARYEKESLEALEIPAAKLCYVDARDRFQIASALIPSMDHNARVIAPWKIAALRQLIAGGGAGAEGRVYISRRRAPVRHVANEAEISEFLRARGFKICELEDFSWHEQTRLFARAQIIIAPHGAALANVVFCRPGTHIIEISTRAGYRDWYLHLTAAAGLNYYCIEAMPVRHSLSSHHADEHDDMLVSREKIEQLISTV
jgi:capsular polysaccharide biosynthesis protein